jgi:hypothetical protein
MCVQVDRVWEECDHRGFAGIEFCNQLGKGCKGPSATHKEIKEPGKCDTCINRERWGDREVPRPRPPLK